MKRKLTLLIICFIAFCGAFCGLNFCVDANASVTSPEITNNTRANFDMDNSLFRALQAIAKQLSYNKNVVGFDADLLTYGYEDYEPNENWNMNEEPYKTWQQNRDAIVNDLKAGKLDLTVGENASYLCLQNSKLEKIKDLSGLNNIDMEKIDTLIINDAQISEVKETDFENLPSLKSLTMKNCGLNSFKLNSNITKLNALDLSENNLTNIDLSTMVGVNPSINLTSNKISNLQDINFGTVIFGKINLNFNLLSNFSNSDYQTLSAKVGDSNNLFIGVQSKNSFDSLIAGDKILVTNFGGNFVNELNLVASYYAGTANSLKSDFYIDGEDNTICETAGTQNIEVIYAPAGKIYFEFFGGNNLIDQLNYPEFKSKYVKVPLGAPNYVLKVDGQVVTDLYQQKDITVEFEVVEDSNIPNLQDVLSSGGAKIYSGTNIKLSEQPQTQLVVTNNGTFSLCAKVEFDGILSKGVNLEVTRQNTTGIVWGVIAILFMFIIGTAIYNVVKWARAGAVVAPLSDKELYRVKKRQERKYGRERQSNKKPLDASLRKAWREANKPQDEILGSELNKQSSSFYNANEQGDYNQEEYDDDYRKFTHSSFDDGYLDEDLNAESVEQAEDIDEQNEDGDEDLI